MPDTTTPDEPPPAGTSTPPDDPSSLPQKGNVLWSADHEVGDFSEWDDGDPDQGGRFYWGTGVGRVTDEVSRTGEHALALTIDTTGVAPSDGARVYRRTETRPAFYGAWFRLQEAHTAGDWWAIVVWHARETSNPVQNVVQLWDIRIVESTEGFMTLQLYEHATASPVTPSTDTVVYPGEWFHLETYLDYRPPDATEIRVWLNDVLIFEKSDVRTSIEDNVFWLVGNGAAELTPSSSTLYVDDATVIDAILSP